MVQARPHGVEWDTLHVGDLFAAVAFDFEEDDASDIATRNRDEIAARMTPAQLAEAQKLARAWRPG